MNGVKYSDIRGFECGRHEIAGLVTVSNNKHLPYLMAGKYYPIILDLLSNTYCFIDNDYNINDAFFKNACKYSSITIWIHENIDDDKNFATITENLIHKDNCVIINDYEVQLL